MSLPDAYGILLRSSAAVVTALIFVCLIRAILGPRFTDRIVAINIISTKVIIMIAILSCLFEENTLLDAAIVYAMISFLAVVVLSKCYIMPRYLAGDDVDYDPSDILPVASERKEGLR